MIGERRRRRKIEKKEEGSEIKYKKKIVQQLGMILL
jgi:hypothetical protein